MTLKLEELSGTTARLENEGGQSGSLSNPSLDAVQLELHQYGIVPVPLMAFDWGGYRYSNARDAIAAAKRPVG